ncbi:MAG: hypothetical protein PWQ27_1792, partial [Kosmotoga sp.]|nr:hypothetical protein [Kosmotoga sp.]
VGMRLRRKELDYVQDACRGSQLVERRLRG